MKNKWTFKSVTYALADTGDYDGHVEFTNGVDVLQTSGDELEDEQCKQFCELLDLMPDLWSHRCDNAEFMKSQYEKERNKLKELVLKLKSENMVSVVGDELIDECLNWLSL